jgi:hypothetical protein
MAMSPKDKAKFQAEWKKPGNVKKGEIITPGAVVRGVAKAAAKVAGKQTAKKRVPATYTPTKKAVPTKVVKRTTPPIYKNSESDALLEQQYAKLLKITKARGGDTKKISVTIDGRTMDYKGIR